MREIEFRGINNETGEFVYGWYTKLQEGARIFDAIIAKLDDEFTRFYIHAPQTIGQFTGLRDKNGVKIFEGDILNYYRSDKSLNFTGKIMHSLDHSQALNRNQDRNISDEDEGFLSTYGLVCNRNYFMALCHYCRPYEYMEVIGNIQQHPQLLDCQN